jgi:hypothetical protein
MTKLTYFTYRKDVTDEACLWVISIPTFFFTLGRYFKDSSLSLAYRMQILKDFKSFKIRPQVNAGEVVSGILYTSAYTKREVHSETKLYSTNVVHTCNCINK